MGTAGQSITLANSIIGVGILAMPFCFQQCGILLATVILLTMGLISRLCCYFLLKSALIARRRNFEFLAFHVFGPAGKLAVEVGIIGFLMGTCIAYFVVVGDLGPQIIAKMLNINQSDILRTSIMVIVSLVCVLPLGLLRNVDSLSNVSAATIGFYFCLVIKVIAEAASQLFAGDWHSKIEMWKPSGVLQCVPIFSMALFCQTQLFELFESLPTLSMEKMNVVTKNAINICTCVYFTLGLFGYIAFCTQTISGNILMSLSPTMASDVIKLGFVMSLAFSFPLIIFPCRASLYSFLFRKAHPAHHDHIINHSIPESTFRCMTVAIIAVALFISLLIPNIELVLGLVGSTIGVLICVVFPAACFINVTFKNTNERVLAKGILILGLVIMVLGTYANLQAAESSSPRYDDKITPERIDKIVEDFFEKMEKVDGGNKPLVNNEPVHEDAANKDSKVQPPNPVPPASNEKVSDVLPITEEKKINPPVQNEYKDSIMHPKNLQTKLNEVEISNNENIVDKAPEKPKEEKVKNEIVQDKTQEKNDMVKQKLVETIKQHEEEQKELMKEQKEILDVIIKTKKELQQNKNEIESAEAKKIAVESIQKIADVAIKSLAGVSEKPGDLKPAEKNEPLEVIANKAVQEIAKKAVEAIEEIKEKELVQSDKDAVKTGNAANVGNVNNNNVNSVNMQNGQVNQQHNEPNNGESSVSNFAPVKPPVLNQNPVAVPGPESPQVQALVHNQNIAHVPEKQLEVSNNAPSVNAQPVLNQIINNAQSNNLPNQPEVLNAKDPVQNIQQNQAHQEQIYNNQPSSQVIPENNIEQQQNQLNLKQKQINQQQNQLNQQQDLLNQQKDRIEQKSQENGRIDTLVLLKEKIDEETKKMQLEQKSPNVQDQGKPNQNVNTNKGHSHAPDEPQSYKEGEDAQKYADMAKNVAQNVPIPIAMNGNAQANQVHINGKNNVNTIQNIGANVNPNNYEPNVVPVRQKREVTDFNKPEELRNTFNKRNDLNKEIESRQEEILPMNIDLAKIGLNVPMEIIHHGRSLKSVNDWRKKR